MNTTRHPATVTDLHPGDVISGHINRSRRAYRFEVAVIRKGRLVVSIDWLFAGTTMAGHYAGTVEYPSDFPVANL